MLICVVSYPRESQNNQNPTPGTPTVTPEPEEPQQIDIGQESERRQLDVTRIMNKLDDLEGNVVPIPGNWRYKVKK